MNPNYYIQYHNVDKLGRYPSSIIDINTSIDLVTLDNSIKEQQIFTSKKLVEKAKGQYCFLIIGKTEEIKKYCLWSFFKIENVEKHDSNYSVKGIGYSFEKPISLNERKDFDDFKNFCGNFGIGFQNISNHPFCHTLIAFTSQQDFDTPRQAEKNNYIYSEGTPITITHTVYERDQNARIKCKEHHGLSCAACGFNFEQAYGELGKDFIHIHHLKPLYQIGENYQIDPITELVPVCPNCHAMIHRKKGVTLSIEELKSQIKSLKQ